MLDAARDREMQAHALRDGQPVQQRKFDLGGVGHSVVLGQRCLNSFLENWVGRTVSIGFVGYRQADVGVENSFAPGRNRENQHRPEPVMKTQGSSAPKPVGMPRGIKFDSFIHTAHFHTSRPASAETVHGLSQKGGKRKC